ncbi:MAG TPA: phosphotransferase [Acidimicrobiia bacterium]|nr:phosphotransferase [Acidimicrobiia bacterium]
MGIWEEQPDLAAWIETTIGGSIRAAERQGRWRVQWMVDVDTPGGRIDLVARMPRDPEFVRSSAFLSHYDTEHEARVLQAMEGTAVPTPRYYGFHQPTESLLIDRFSGSGDFRLLEGDARHEVLDQYVAQMVAIHRLPTETLDAVGAQAPNGAIPGGQLQWMRLDYDRARSTMRPEPLLEFSLWWLEHHLPADRDRRAIVQGDTGPGQFMFEDRRLIGLIDWELADIDHPMLDLGVMRMRNVLYPMGPLDEPLELYAQLSGRPLDLEAIRYFTVVASLVSLLGMAPSMQSPSARIDSMLPRLAWDVSMRRCLCEALIEAMGIAVVPPELPPAVPTSRTPLHDFLVEHLEFGCAGLADDDYDRYLLDGAGGLARALRLLDQVGPAFDEADLDDMAEVLGTRPRDSLEADVRLADRVANDPEADAPALLRLWYRMAVRREYSWGPLMLAQGSAPLAPMAEHLGQDVPVRS